MEAPVLSVRNLTTRLTIEGIPYKVVDRLSFDLEQGRTLALVGESGCGKSMTALSLMRILPKPPALPPEGEVLYKGCDLLKLKETEMRKIRGAKIAMIFQDPMTALNPVYTIGYQMLEVARLHLGLHGDAAEQRVVSALEDVQLTNPLQLLKEYPHQMSGGMLQRVMIAMAFICEPDVLIADEPTTALDVTIQSQILSLMQELQESRGMAILLITHDMSVVAEMAHDVIVMYASERIEQGDVYALFDYPSHPYTQGLFRSRPERTMREGKLSTIQGSVPPLQQLPQGCHFHPRCPYVMDLCKKGEVPNFSLPRSHHLAKCWLYDPELQKKI